MDKSKTLYINKRKNRIQKYVYVNNHLSLRYFNYLLHYDKYIYTYIMLL